MGFCLRYIASGDVRPVATNGHISCDSLKRVGMELSSEARSAPELFETDAAGKKPCGQAVVKPITRR